MINHEELERLADVIYSEVCRVWREQVKYPNPQMFVPFAEQSEVVRTSYISGAAAANTTIINAMVRRSCQSVEPDEK